MAPSTPFAPSPAGGEAPSAGNATSDALDGPRSHALRLAELLALALDADEADVALRADGELDETRVIELIRAGGLRTTVAAHHFSASVLLEDPTGTPVGVLSLRDGRARALTGREERIILGFARLIEEAVALTGMASTDAPPCPVTGLMLKGSALAHMAQLLERAERVEREVALVIADIVDFNAINSAFGRDTGDRLLRRAADRLRLLVPRDALVFRVQGDQFGIALELGSGATDVEGLLSTVATGFDAPLFVGERGVVLQLVFGTAVFPSRARSASELLDRAFLALRRAQEQRTLAEVFTTELEERLVREVALEQRLRFALTEQRLSVVYQPKIALPSGALCGVEALCRWHDPELGTVPPSEFIPIAERTGLIGDLGRQVLETALRDVLRLRERVPTATVAVNVAATQLRSVDFVDEVIEALARSGAPSSALELEVVETSLIEDLDGAVRVMERLRDLGIALSIDDFGTGYSSLAYLRRLPVHTLKIDRGFVSAMTATARDAALVESIISMAHVLGFEVVAEGVETRVQADLLLEMGCDGGQGYFWARPEPIESLLARGVADGPAPRAP